MLFRSRLNDDFEAALLPGTERSYQHQLFQFDSEIFQYFYSYTRHCMLQPFDG